MPAKKWDKQAVIAAIQRREREGLPMTAFWREGEALYSAAKVCLGSWRKAVAAAGPNKEGGRACPA